MRAGRPQLLRRRPWASTPSSNVVPASGLHTQRNYADQLLFPDPDSFRVIPWLEKTASVVCLGYGTTASRSARRRAGCSPSSSSRPTSSATTSCSATNTSTTCSTTATKKRLYEGIHIFHTVRNQYVPFLDALVPTLRAYGIDVITHNCEYAGSQYETNLRAGHESRRRRQGLRLQERHEGARAPQRLHRELHGQALRRAVGQRLPPAHQPRRPQDRRERLPRPTAEGTALGRSARPSSKASSRTRRR